MALGVREPRGSAPRLSNSSKPPFLPVSNLCLDHSGLVNSLGKTPRAFGPRGSYPTNSPLPHGLTFIKTQV